MLQKVTRKAQDAAARTARKAALGLGGAVCLVVGIGFFTASAWMVLTELTDTLTATMIIGGFYSGAGFILFAIASATPVAPELPEEPEPNKPQDTDEIMPQMVAAFMTGVQAGRKART